MNELSELCSVRYAEAGDLRLSIPALADVAAGGDGSAESVARRLGRVAARTVCVTLLAGSGSRWLASLEAGRASADPGTAARAAAFPPVMPRALFRVADHISGRPEGIAIAAYSVDAVDRAGKHLLVVRGWEEEIRREILAPLGIPSDRAVFATQELFRGKPRGHGDAAWQCRDAWKDARYVVTNFGGDPNSPLTVLSALLALDALLAAGERVDLLLPAAPAIDPAYPIRFDARGYPVSFGHAKLRGGSGSGGTGYTNVGLRVYRAEALFRMSATVRDRWWNGESGYAIPGNDPAGGEFALDNVDLMFAGAGTARVLATARPEELAFAKSFDIVPRFEEATARIRSEWTSCPLAAALSAVPGS